MIKTLFMISMIFINGAIIANEDSSQNTNSKLIVNVPSTLQVKDITEKHSDSVNSKMPWVVALTIGIISAFVNIFVGKRLQKSNEKNIKQQIENSKELAVTQFKANIAANNRQEWINELRHNISQYVSDSIQLIFEIRVQKTNAESESVKNLVSKLLYTKTKIELYLNSSKPEQECIIKNVNSILSEVLRAFTDPDKYDDKKVRDVREELIKNSKLLFNLHWEKIKKLD